MILIKTDIKIIVEIPYDTAGYGCSHSKNIDEEIQFVLHHIAKGNEELVF
jgi:hypothetical protein